MQHHVSIFLFFFFPLSLYVKRKWGRKSLAIGSRLLYYVSMLVTTYSSNHQLADSIQRPTILSFERPNGTTKLMERAMESLQHKSWRRMDKNRGNRIRCIKKEVKKLMIYSVNRINIWKCIKMAMQQVTTAFSPKKGYDCFGLPS